MREATPGGLGARGTEAAEVHLRSRGGFGSFAGSDGVGVSDAAVTAMNPRFPATCVADDLPAAGDGVGLLLVVTARPRGARSDYVPGAPFLVRHDVPLVVVGHVSVTPLLCYDRSARRREPA